MDIKEAYRKVFESPKRLKEDPATMGVKELLYASIDSISQNVFKAMPENKDCGEWNLGDYILLNPELEMFHECVMEMTEDEFYCLSNMLAIWINTYHDDVIYRDLSRCLIRKQSRAAA